MAERRRASGSEDLRDGQRSVAGGSLAFVHDFRNLLQLAASTLGLARRRIRRNDSSDLDSLLLGALEALDRANLMAHRLGLRDYGGEDAEPVLLQTLVPELRALLSPALGDGIRFESLVAGDLRPVVCDPLELENALLNLALNARQAMTGGGTLTIEALTCARSDHGDCVALAVADTGCGMAEEVAKRAFEPFFSTRLLDGGSGVGLYNVRRFIETAGGSVQLSTRKDEGTRVILHLPAMREPWQRA